MHDSTPLVQHALYPGGDGSVRIWRAAVDDWPEVHRESKALRGIKRFLNIYEIRHWVVIASFGRREDAVRFADEVRDFPPTRQVYVGITGPWNRNYPVFAAPGEPLDDAQRRLAAVKGIPMIRRNQPYLSAY